jgi:MOSC domain-containing protein YiiM
MKHKKVETGIFKRPVDHPVALRKLGVTGDAIADLIAHGGEDQAVYAYSYKHYTYWSTKYPDLKYTYGTFGENLTVSDLDEEIIRVGNQYSCGDVLLEVTKPRQPCYKLGLVFGTHRIVKEFWNTTKSGIYFRILKEGTVQSGDEMKLIYEAKDNPTIAEVFENKRSKKN